MKLLIAKIMQSVTDKFPFVERHGNCSDRGKWNALCKTCPSVPL